MKKFDIRDSVFDAIEKYFQKNDQCYFLTADQGSFGYNILAKKYPKRIINVGIAEQNMIGIAAGIALEKKKVFVYAISSFLFSRAYEQIKLNLCSMNLNVCLIASGPGLCYSPDGPTHYSLEDTSIYNNLPNMKIYSPYDRKTSFASINDFVKNKGPAVIRCDKGLYTEQKKSNLDAVEIIKGKSNVIISHGNFINSFTEKKDELIKKGIGLIAINKLKKLNVKKFLQIIKKYKNLFFVDETWPNSSYGIYLLKILSDKSINKKLNIWSLNEEFHKEGGGREELLKNNKLNIKSILAKIL
jgi:transketolase